MWFPKVVGIEQTRGRKLISSVAFAHEVLLYYYYHREGKELLMSQSIPPHIMAGGMYVMPPTKLLPLHILMM